MTKILGIQAALAADNMKDMKIRVQATLNGHITDSLFTIVAGRMSDSMPNEDPRPSGH